jgi:glucan phosphoethanolaminetransferase (alkaline phosphatase superfamily)
MPLVKRIVALGIIVGFFVGALRGFFFVHANRYLELGMYNIALSSLCSILTRFSLLVPLVFLASLVSCVAIIGILRARLREELSTERYAYSVTAASTVLAFYVLATCFLNTSDWYPPAFSRRGIAYNGLLTILFAVAAFAVLRRRPLLSQAAQPGRLASRLLVSGTSAVVLVTLIANGLSRRAHSQPDVDPLNVLLITVDTLRADHLGAYGYGRNTSPHIDELARTGVLFSQAIAQWPKTTPSFASMMTGTYAHHHGLVRYTQQRLPDRFVVLAEVLRNANYDTVGIVTNGNLAKAFNFDQGFATYVEMWRTFADERAEHVTDHALSWLKQNASHHTFFMWLHYSDPHAPYEPPPPYSEMYVGDRYYGGTQRVGFNADFDTDMGGIPGRSRLGDHDVLDYYVAQYDAEIRYTDDNIGKVLTAVTSMGLTANTLIVLTADHGESLGSHDYYFEIGRAHV